MRPQQHRERAEQPVPEGRCRLPGARSIRCFTTPIPSRCETCPARSRTRRATMLKRSSSPSRRRLQLRGLLGQQRRGELRLRQRLAASAGAAASAPLPASTQSSSTTPGTIGRPGKMPGQRRMIVARCAEVAACSECGMSFTTARVPTKARHGSEHAADEVEHVAVGLPRKTAAAISVLNQEERRDEQIADHVREPATTIPAARSPAA